MLKRIDARKIRRDEQFPDDLLAPRLPLEGRRRGVRRKVFTPEETRLRLSIRHKRAYAENPEYRARAVNRALTRYRRLRAEGKCIKCGNPSHGYIHCPPCRVEYNLNYNQPQKPSPAPLAA